MFHKPDRSLVNQTGHLDLLTTDNVLSPKNFARLAATVGIGMRTRLGDRKRDSQKARLKDRVAAASGRRGKVHVAVWEVGEEVGAQAENTSRGSS